MTFGERFEGLIDSSPLHWTLIFHLSVIAAVVLVLWQIKTADILNAIRWNGTNGWLLTARRLTMFAKLAGLLWAVIYSQALGWQPWPPIVAFVIAFDAHTALDIYLMSEDIKMLRACIRAGMTPPFRPITTGL
jgi:hypothetical protein